jgi:hypothetical protein
VWETLTLLQYSAGNAESTGRMLVSSESPLRGDSLRSMNTAGMKSFRSTPNPVPLGIILQRHSSALNQKRRQLMELKSQYKVISGTPLEIEQTLNLLAQDGWHPVTMASLALPNVVAVILESKIMDESSRKITSSLRDAVSLEEVQ